VIKNVAFFAQRLRGLIPPIIKTVNVSDEIPYSKRDLAQSNPIPAISNFCVKNATGIHFGASGTAKSACSPLPEACRLNNYLNSLNFVWKTPGAPIIRFGNNGVYRWAAGTSAASLRQTAGGYQR
jgi:hypothetical protein